MCISILQTCSNIEHLCMNSASSMFRTSIIRMQNFTSHTQITKAMWSWRLRNLAKWCIPIFKSNVECRKCIDYWREAGYLQAHGWLHRTIRYIYLDKTLKSLNSKCLFRTLIIRIQNFTSHTQITKAMWVLAIAKSCKVAFSNRQKQRGVQKNVLIIEEKLGMQAHGCLYGYVYLDIHCSNLWMVNVCISASNFSWLIRLCQAIVHKPKWSCTYSQIRLPCSEANTVFIHTPIVVKTAAKDKNTHCIFIMYT